MKKIAFLFLIYDKINMEELWKKFFKKIDNNKYNIYIHFKINKPLKYFEKYKLCNCIPTSYADISIVRAQNILLKEALKDENNEHFIFLSNSCVPFKNFDYIYNKLTIDKSYFNITPQTQCFPRCNDLLKYIEKNCIQKASQWCILNRNTVHFFINNNYTYLFNDEFFAPDEHYFNNLCKKFKIKFLKRKITYNDWKNSKGRPKTYYDLINEKVYNIQKKNPNAFFMRKIDKTCILPSYFNTFVD